MRLRSLCIRTIKMKRQRHGNQVTQLNPGRLPNAPSAPPFSAWKSWNVWPETISENSKSARNGPDCNGGESVLRRDLELAPSEGSSGCVPWKRALRRKSSQVA